MSWRFDLGDKTSQQRAIIMQRDAEEKLRREEAKRKFSVETDDSKEISPVFRLTYANTNAKAQEIEGEFVVLEGSLARKAQTNSLADTYILLREKLVKEGNLIDCPNNDGSWIFTQNVPFQSPSTAASVISGASLNGRQYWKVEDSSQSYAKWCEEMIKQTGK